MKFLWTLGSAVAAGLGVVAAEEQLLRDFVPSAVFENVEYSQTYDLTGTYVKKSVSLKAKNVGTEPEKAYYYSVESEVDPHVAVLEARVSGTDAPLPLVLEGVDSEHDALLYKLELPEPLAANEEVSLEIAQAITGLLSPLPESGTQGDSQFLFYQGSRYAFSPYPIKKLSSNFRPIGTQAQEIDADESDKPDVTENMVKYGPYKDVEPYSSKPVKIRFENPKPMAKASKLIRDVWVSHWAQSVSFEETYWIHNFGTKLKDSFSRLKYQMGQSQFNLNIAALKELNFPLKPKARDAYYTDLVGNVSTSNFRSNSRSSVFTVRPRYPVFGGWNYNFTVGWSLDLDNYVRDVGDDQYLLKVPFVEGPADIYYDEIDFRVVLPEGATDIQVLSLMGTESDRGIMHWFLDTVGRPTVNLKYENVIDGHRRGEVFVKYKYTNSDILRKPLTIAATFMAFFAVLIVISNIDISIIRRNGNKKSK